MQQYPLIHLLLLPPNKPIKNPGSLKSPLTPRTSEKLTLISSGLISYLLTVENAFAKPPRTPSKKTVQ
jgi:hypothetical protein